jgi:hypothetical protein
MKINKIKIVIMALTLLFSKIVTCQILTLNNNAILSINDAEVLTCVGNLEVNNSSGITGNGSISFVGTEPQLISGTNVTLPAITFENPTTVEFKSNSIINGLVNLGSSKVYISEGNNINTQTNTILRTTGYFQGLLKKTFTNLQNSRVFEVGIGGFYTPAEISYTSVPTNFSVSVSSDTNITVPTSRLSIQKFIKCFWNVNADSIAPNTYSISIIPNNNLLIGTTTTSQFKSTVFSLGSWSSPIPLNSSSTSNLSSIQNNYGIVTFGESSAISIAVKVLLEGFYPGSGQSIAPVLSNSGINVSTNLSDSITIELRENQSPFATIASKKVALNIYGEGLVNIDGISPDTFFLVTKHRNHLSTWSNEPILCNENTSYDFSNSQNKAYGNNLSTINTNLFGLYAGDLNLDGIIDASDYTDVDNDNYNYNTGYSISDVNGDGLTDASDFTFIDNNNFNYKGSLYPSGAGFRLAQINNRKNNHKNNQQSK